MPRPVSVVIEVYELKTILCSCIGVIIMFPRNISDPVYAEKRLGLSRRYCSPAHFCALPEGWEASVLSRRFICPNPSFNSELSVHVYSYESISPRAEKPVVWVDDLFVCLFFYDLFLLRWLYTISSSKLFRNSFVSLRQCTVAICLFHGTALIHCPFYNSIVYCGFIAFFSFNRSVLYFYLLLFILFYFANSQYLSVFLIANFSFIRLYFVCFCYAAHIHSLLVFCIY